MTLVVAIEEIVVPENRQRKKFDAEKHKNLRQSISDFGLLHALVVEDQDGVYVLVAGERRMRAIKELDGSYLYGKDVIDAGHAPVVLWDELSSEQRIALELEENIQREDLTWQERTAALAKLHAFRVENALPGVQHTIAATAAEITGVPAAAVSGSAREEVSAAVKLAAHMDNPDIAGAKSQKEALNILRRTMEADFQRELEKRYGFEQVATEHTALLGDCMGYLRAMETGTFTAVLSDPPYGVGAHTWTPQSGSDSGMTHQYDDDPKETAVLIQDMLKELYRVTKPQAHLYFFCDVRMWNQWSIWAAAAGWEPWYVPLIWDKGGQGNIVGKVDGPRRTYETIMYCRKGGMQIAQLYGDVIRVPPAQNRRHAAEKPVDLYTFLLRNSCIPGDRVIDTCMGSGTIFPAANELKLIATGIEKVESHFNTARSRLNEGEVNVQSLPGV